MASEGEDQEREELRAVAVRSAVANMVGLGIQLAIIVAIAKRDTLWRRWRRWQWHVMQEWRGAEEERVVAEVRWEISRIEHGG